MPSSALQIIGPRRGGGLNPDNRGIAARQATRRPDVMEIITGKPRKPQRVRRPLPANIRDEGEMFSFVQSLARTLGTPNMGDITPADIDLGQAISAVPPGFPATAPPPPARTGRPRQDPRDVLIGLGIDPATVGFGQ